MITILLPISRTTYLKPMFDCLDTLERPKDTELLIITDGDSALERAVDKRLDSISYPHVRVLSFGNKAAENINDRRYRIAAIHNKTKHYIAEDCEYIFALEDDTVCPPDTLTKLLHGFNSVDNCAFIEGVELGRWNYPYIGAWKTDNVFEPNEFLSAMPSHGIAEIDAGGLYCALIDADLYKMHNFQPFDTEGKNGLSCDVNFGLYLRQQGYKCYIDHSIQCDHIGVKGSVNLGNTKPVQVRFSRMNNKWTGETL